MVLSMIVLVIVVALIIFMVAGSKLDPQKGGEDMIKNVYLYLVLFATLMMTIGGSVAAFMAVADIVAPTPYYQSYDEFRRWGGPEKPYPAPEGTPEEKLTDEEIKAKYEAMVSAEKERQIERAKNNLIKSFGWIVIPFPIFVYFQRRLIKNKEQEA